MKHVTVNATPEEQLLLASFRMLPDEYRRTSMRYMEALVRRVGVRSPTLSLLTKAGGSTPIKTMQSIAAPTLRLVTEGGAR